MKEIKELNEEIDIDDVVSKHKSQKQVTASEPENDIDDEGEVPYWMEGVAENQEEERLEEEKRKREELDPQKNKTGIGVLCGLFIPFFIAIIVGCCLYQSGTTERGTFFKGFWWTIGICYSIAVYIAIIISFCV